MILAHVVQVKNTKNVVDVKIRRDAVSIRPPVPCSFAQFFSSVLVVRKRKT